MIERSKRKLLEKLLNSITPKSELPLELEQQTLRSISDLSQDIKENKSPQVDLSPLIEEIKKLKPVDNTERLTGLFKEIAGNYSDLKDAVKESGKPRSVVSGGQNAWAQDRQTLIPGSGFFQPIGGIFNDTLATVSTNAGAYTRITQYRAEHVNLRDSNGVELGTPTSPVNITGTFILIQGTITAISNVSAGTIIVSNVNAGTLTTVTNVANVSAGTIVVSNLNAGTLTTISTVSNLSAGTVVVTNLNAGTITTVSTVSNISAGTVIVSQVNQGTITALHTQFNRSDSFSATGTGVVINVTNSPTKSYAIQVDNVGGVASVWDVRLEGSIDSGTFTTILTHTNTTGDGVVLFSGAALYPALYFRSRVAGLTLGLASNIVVNILGL